MIVYLEKLGYLQDNEEVILTETTYGILISKRAKDDRRESDEALELYPWYRVQRVVY